MPVNGLVTMTPSSIVSTGTGNSSSINTNGSVTFSTCQTLSLNNVFTGNYDNYMISVRGVGSTTQTVQFRFRANGTDNSTASSYVVQTLSAASTTLTTTHGAAANDSQIGAFSSSQRDGFTTYVFGPYLTQATAWRSVSISSATNATLWEFAGTHNQSSAYDGITLIASTGSFTGLATVYGFNQ